MATWLTLDASVCTENVASTGDDYDDHAVDAPVLLREWAECESPAWHRIRTPSPENTYATQLAARGLNRQLPSQLSQPTPMAYVDVRLPAPPPPLVSPSVCDFSAPGPTFLREGGLLFPNSHAASSSFQPQALQCAVPWPGAPPPLWQALPAFSGGTCVSDTPSTSACTSAYSSTDAASSAGTLESVAEAESSCPAGILGLLGPQLPSEGLGGGNHARSRGSAGHPHFCGKPCRYVASQRGCMEGAKCTRCHICARQKRRAARRGMSEANG